MSEFQPRTARLARELLKHLPDQGIAYSPVPRVGMFRADHTTKCSPALYEPCLIFVLQGAKRGYFGDQVFRYDPSTHLAFTVPMPVESQILEASPEKPFLALAVLIEPAEINDILLQIEEDKLPPAEEPAVISASPLTDPLLDTLERLIATFDDKSDAQVLGALVRRELIYRIILGPQGPALRAALARQNHFRQIGDLMLSIHKDCAQQITTDDMCRLVGMSKSSLHESFKAITAMSPLQYVKSIRLHQARAHILNEGLSASTAGFRVGYASASQFSREFKRMFGVPPSQVTELG